MRYRLLIILTLLMGAMSCARGQFIATVDLLPVPDAAGLFSESAAFNHVAPAQFSDAVFFRADGESRLTIELTLLPIPGVPADASFFQLVRVDQTEIPVSGQHVTLGPFDTLFGHHSLAILGTATMPPAAVYTVSLVLAAVPEPHAWLLILSGLGAGVLLARRARID